MKNLSVNIIMDAKIQELFNKYSIDYYDIENKNIHFIFDNCEFIIYPDLTWIEVGHSNINISGDPIKNLDNYLDWILYATEMCEQYGLLSKGIEHWVAHIDKRW